MTLRLHYFFWSFTSTRLRAALNHKRLDYDCVPYVLRDGETRTPEYLNRNPQGLVPTLEREDGSHLTQSLAIIEWLEETHPVPALLPKDADGRARVRALAQMIALEVHPLNSLRVMFDLRDAFGADEAAQTTWCTHWVTQTSDVLDATLATGRPCHDDQPTLADLCFYAQIWNNKCFDIALDRWPTVARIFADLDQLPASTKAAPPNQPAAA